MTELPRPPWTPKNAIDPRVAKGCAYLIVLCGAIILIALTAALVVAIAG